jgi:DNA repair protein RadC
MKDITQVAEITISYRPTISHKPLITSSLDAYTTVKDFFDQDTLHLQEQFVVMFMNRANRVIGINKLSFGGITGTVADIRLILGIALKTASTGIILSHNHPSGNLKPSFQDEQLTQKIKQAAELMDIKLLDHLIIGTNNEYISMADDGFI